MIKTNHPSPKRILLSVGFQPYPTLFGGAVDVWERIVGLHQLGHSIDVVFTEKKAPSDEDLIWMKRYVDNVYYVPRKNHWKQLFSSLPLQVRSREGLKDVVFAKPYDWVIAEGEYCAQVIENPTLIFDQLILRVHNDEAYYFEQLKKSVSSKKEKLYYTLEVPKIRKYSRMVLEQAHRLWYISSEEFQRSNHPNKSVFLPVPVNDRFQEFSSIFKEKVLFVGSLFMPNNIFALDWYLEHIHQHFIHRPSYELVVVGAVKTKEEEEVFRNKYKAFDKVSMHFNQKDLSPFYKEAKVFINPMFHGSGVKIKSVMSLVNALPLVSTTVGAEGMGLDASMYWKADDAIAFTKALEHIFSSEIDVLKNKVEAAQEHLKNHHYLKVLEREINGF